MASASARTWGGLRNSIRLRRVPPFRPPPFLGGFTASQGFVATYRRSTATRSTERSTEKIRLVDLVGGLGVGGRREQ
jgi:hypothetical protein